MVISPEHRYIFIQNSHTASTAVGKELVEQYQGKFILHKHAYYDDLRKWTNNDLSDYFILSAVRNPMDITVSRYHKLKHNTWRDYSVEALLRYNDRLTAHRINRHYRFIHERGATFAEYYDHFFHGIYCNRLMPSYNRLNHVMRFESLQDDFSTALQMLGIDQKRPVPVFNVTQRDCSSYVPFYTEEVRQKAIRMFGPQMQVWGYAFPREWNAPPVTWSQEAAFSATCLAMAAFLRYSPSSPRNRVESTFEEVAGTYELNTQM